MIKQFLKDLYVHWRTLEGLPVRQPYAEEYLGKVHSKPSVKTNPRASSEPGRGTNPSVISEPRSGTNPPPLSEPIAARGRKEIR
jgi:hypothetical protein